MVLILGGVVFLGKLGGQLHHPLKWVIEKEIGRLLEGCIGVLRNDKFGLVPGMLHLLCVWTYL